MNPYTILSSGLGTQEARAFGARLSAWHDAMVAHERRLRTVTTSDACDDECPHTEVRSLWSEAVAMFGARAQQLVFLRSRAQETRRSVSTAESTDAYSAAADYVGRRAAESRPSRTTKASVAAASAAAEL